MKNEVAAFVARFVAEAEDAGVFAVDHENALHSCGDRRKLGPNILTAGDLNSLAIQDTEESFARRFADLSGRARFNFGVAGSLKDGGGEGMLRVLFKAGG